MQIHVFPDPILRERAEKIEEITPEIAELGKKMVQTMQDANGIGLAGNQVGIKKCIFTIDRIEGEGLEVKSPTNHSLDTSKTQILINPIITERSGSDLQDEGCLSFPGIYATADRPKRVVIKALDINGNELEIIATGFYARVFDHEIDHLNGVLFIDKLTPASRLSIATQLKNLKKKFK